MKSKTKKFMAIICLALLLLTSLPINTFAAFITDMNSNAQFGVISGSLAKVGHELHYATYDGQTYIAFCCQKGVKSPNGSEYTFNGDFYVQYKQNLPQYEKIAEMIYFGYTMKYGLGLPSSDEAYRAACCTQQYVWEYIHNNINSSFDAFPRDSWNGNFMSSGHYANWVAEAEGYYNQYHGNTSFNCSTQSVAIGDRKVITDNNGKLSAYQSFSQSKDGVTFSHTQGSNDLVITISDNCNVENVTFNSREYGLYQLMPNGSAYNSSTMSNYMYFTFTSGSVQNLIFSNYVDPSAFSVSVHVESGKIEIRKTNNMGNAVSDCVFGLYRNNECTDLVKKANTNNEGKILIEKLKPGTYFVKEESVASGYLLDTSIQRVNVAGGQTASVTFKNNEPTGQIKIYKVSTNNDKIAGAEFEVKANEDIYNVAKTKKFYSKGQVVAKITSNSDGVATLSDIPVGKYIVYETQAPKGYLLNETIFNANIQYVNSTTPVIELKIEGVVDTEPKGSIEIIKKDSETGSMAQGDATLENAVYKVFANEDIYNVAKSKKYYSKGDLVATRTMDKFGNTTPVEDLPLGKYIVKEDKASVGYLLDKTEYPVNLEYKDQHTKVIANKTTSNEDVKKMGVHIFKSGIKVNSGETPGLEGAEFTIKLNSAVEKAYSQGYTYAEVWNGVDENGNKVNVDTKRVAEAQKIAPTYDVLVTDKDGNAYTQKNLPYGKYIVKETVTPKDYESASDFYFSITQDESEIKEIPQKTKHIVVNNEQLEAYIKLIKKDLKTGKVVTLSSTTFDIKAEKDIYDRATGKIIWKKGESISQKIGGTTYNSFTTNADNMIVPDKSYTNNKDDKGAVITPLQLPVGSYAIYEIKTPKGFLQLESPVTFEIKGIRDYDKDQDEDFIKEVVMKNEQPTGTLIINKTIALRKDADTSLVDTSDLSGIQFKLTAKEDIIDYADGSKIYSKSQEIKKYNLDKKGNLKVDNLPMGTYELEEIKTLDGLVLNTTKYEVKFVQKDLTTKVYEDIKDIYNDTTMFEFSKKSVIGDDELEGAKLSVIDENNKIVDTWTSTKNTHKIEGLVVGKTYKLKEEIAPDGYVRASTIEFKVESTTKVQQVKMIDKIVAMTKADIGGKEIEGAEIVVIDKDGNIIDSWTSTKESHNIKGLEEGKKYILHEEYAPDGYVVATDVEFEVTTKKDIQKVEMIDKVVEISKQDIAGEELEGATLVVTNEKTKEIVDRWVSTNEPHKVNGLKEGQKYNLHEEVVVDGYVKASDIQFEVTTDKETQHIVMIDKIVTMSKVDVGGKEIEGAEIVVTDKDGNKIDSWTSDKEEHKIKGLEEGKTYILHEEVTADGYVKATDIEFTVSYDKQNEHLEMVDKVLKVIKTDLVTGEEIEGAELQVVDEEGNIIDEWTSTKEAHVVNGLEEGKKYKLIEKTAPYGYELTEEIEFEVTTDKETQLVEMKDMPILNDITLIKIDADTKAKILDKFTFGLYADKECTQLLQQVDSNKDEGTITFEDLRYGTYYVKEISAPKGYQKSDKVVKVEINDKGIFVDDKLIEKDNNEVYSFEFEDHIIETPKTGDEGHIRIWFAVLGISLVAFLGAIIYFKKFLEK